MLDAYETVESWMMARNRLNPGKLIPAMMRYVSEPHAKYDRQKVYSFFYCNIISMGLHILTAFLQKEINHVREPYNLFFVMKLLLYSHFISVASLYGKRLH
jgi:hypothetical protein